jgi:hypothetical protein
MSLLNPGAFTGDQWVSRKTGKSRRTSRQERVMPTDGRAASIERRTNPVLAADVADLIRTLRALLDPYRPELHYMRGPGPKWHAKHNPARATSDVVPADLRHAKA